MPTPGPVAYQVQSFLRTSFEMSIGFVQVVPSSVLLDTQTVRVPLALPDVRAASVSPPRFCVMSNQIVPVSRSTTGHGLPQVLPPSCQTTCVSNQVLPSSLLRRRSRSISPVSLRLFLRPSQNARTRPFLDTISEGIR